MRAFPTSILYAVVLCLTVSIHATVYPVMISAPNKPTEAVTGETVSFKWHYNSGDLKNDLFEIVFGIWKSPGFLKTKLIAVNSSGFASTRSSYKSSVGWVGNLTSSTAVFELYNVKLEDGKTYGIVVEYGLQNTPLTDSIQLQVKSRPTGSPETTTPQQTSVTTAARATNTGSRDTSKEPDVSVPRKPSEESSFKWAVAFGIIACVVITLTAGLYFHHHKKSPKHGAYNPIFT
ncbi:unnamed protein product [Pocillopora meandrina]|uniref:Uncharacterized protein n=1 Tax=Pocillopora meandrina TaxID=46732 RepID=A0AAU9W2C7_9CNID|nr:unnamed protein product [Pocillopora meandrina]